MTYFTVPAFQTGDVLSATKLNQVLSNVDSAYGSDQRMEIAPVTGLWNPVGLVWSGWVAFNGEDTLVVYLVGGASSISVEFDQTNKTFRQTWSFTSGGIKTLTLAQPGLYRRGEVYCLRVTNTFPLYAYLTSTSCVTVGTMPAFTNGTASSAADFNTVRDATDRLHQYFSQPMISTTSYGGEKKLSAGYSFDVWQQYRHNTFRWLSLHRGPASGSQTEHVKFYVVKSNIEYEFWTADLQRNQVIPLAERTADLSSIGLTVGAWYKFGFAHENVDGQSPGDCHVYWCGQERYNTVAAWTPLERWDYGDTVNGSAGTTPNLDTMAENIAWLNTNRRRWNNFVMRQNVTRNADPYAERERFFSKRVHRWLAYENLNDQDGAVLLWSTANGNTFQSYDLPASYTTAYFDFEQSPVQMGQVFYIDNVKYAIQVDAPREGTIFDV